MKKVDGQKVSDWAIYKFESGQSERIKLIERMWTVHQNSYLEHTLTLFALCGLSRKQTILVAKTDDLLGQSRRS